jgi:hypothetical protein
VPPGLEGAVIRAREKIADNKPLGFDIDDIITDASKRKSKDAERAKEKSAVTP